MDRDDFLQKVKDILERRVNSICSNPNCRNSTSGPNSSCMNKSVNIGVAAHICAASPNGPRYDPNMTPEQRSSIDNGIWLCQNCAKLIDSDTNTYTIELLYQWKEEAENFANRNIGRPIQIQNNQSNYTINLNDLNSLISSIKYIKDIAIEINNNQFYETYKPAYDQQQDVKIYNIFVDVYNCFNNIHNIKSKYYIQFNKINIDIISISEYIFSLKPKFYYEEPEYGDGCQMLATICSYLDFFKTIPTNFITKLDELIGLLKLV